MFSFVCTRARSAQPCLRPWTHTPFLPSHAFFSSTRPIAITRVQRERESQEARAARLARQRQHNQTVRENETGQEREARLVRQRQYNSLERHKAYLRRLRRIPENREKAKQATRAYRQEHPVEHNLAHEQLSIRRATTLVKHVFHGRPKSIAETYTWKTHAPVSFDDKVEHRCTACDQSRFLKYWWREKPRPEATETSSHHDRYMCSRCFASDWNLVVPETYSGRLSKLFTSPDYPPPYRQERLKAEKSAQKVKKEHEEDQKEERP